MPTDDDRRRFDEERRRQAEANQRLERSLIEAFVEWIRDTAGRVVKNAIRGFLDWLKALF